MNLYKNENITISLIEQEDKPKVLEYFAGNDFNCDHETGALKPTVDQFSKIIDSIISGGTNDTNILVLKKCGEVIGYESMYVEYDLLHIGHIVVKKSERGQRYGELLTRLAILIAENENRNVALYCAYPNSYLKKLGFETSDNINYFYKRKEIKTNGIPKLFISIDDYQKREDKKAKKHLDHFVEFLNSDLYKSIFNDDNMSRR